MLIEKLNVTLADLMPIKGLALTIAGEPTPYRLSERLMAALQEEANSLGVTRTHLARQLREEIHQLNQVAG